MIPSVIEETIRWETPVVFIQRLTTRAVGLAGVDIPAGCQVTVALGAANRDPSRWREPARFDPGRPPVPNVGFGTGPHVCIGMHLARMEAEVVTDAVLDRLRALRLDPDARDVHIRGLTLRSPSALPVVFEPA
jgi:cytochrome P450